MKLVIMGNFLSFYPSPPPPKNPKNQNFEKMNKILGDIIIFQKSCVPKSTIYEVGFPRYRVRQKEFFVILSHFLPFYPQQPPQKFFWQNKNSIWIVISLNMCTKNNNHMMYTSWDMECNKKFFVILGHFLPLYLTNNLKNQNFEKNEKKHLEISSFYCSVLQTAIIWYIVTEICSMTDRIFCHFGPFFVYLPP